MNCRNCGAPLNWRAGRSLLRCSYCDSVHRSTSEHYLTDRILWKQAVGRYACPECRQPLEAVSLDEFPAEGCRNCGGLLLVDQIFADVVRIRRATYVGADCAPSPIDRTQLDRVRACPGCTRSMETHPYYGPGRKVIDSCAACGLIWVDSGELAAIEQSTGRR